MNKNLQSANFEGSIMEFDLELKIGALMTIDMREGIYQVVKIYRRFDENGNTNYQYFVRRVFNKKNEFVPRKCEIIGRRWLFDLSPKKQKMIDEIIASNPEIKTFLDDLNVEERYIYASGGAKIIKKASVKKIEELANNCRDKENSDFVDFDAIASIIKQFEKLNEVRNMPSIFFYAKYLHDDENYYRLEFGGYESEMNDSKFRDFRLKLLNCQKEEIDNF